MAGTGKSTISRTIAQEFDNQGKLGASFFFKRGEGDRGNASRFFPTIVAQLVRHLPSMKTYVQRALDDDSAIASKTLKEQFEKLFLQPLTEVEMHTKVVLIVIDALDECDNDGNIKLILQLLGSLQTQTNVHPKVFITSRPELPIRLGFSEMSEKAHTDVVLHDIPATIVEHDLIVYLTSELEQIRERNKEDLPQNWPGNDNIRALAAMAIPLFIFAATICRFIGDDRWDPGAQLEAVLEYRDADQGDQLDRTYRPVLDRLFSGLGAPQKLLFAKEFQLIVGSIVILESPLSSGSLAKLLSTPTKNVDRKLNLLHSVLNVPSDPILPIRLLHLSFRDFLVDKRRHREGELFISEEQAHQKLATCCIQLLLHTDCLKQDICELNHPGILRQDIDSHVIAKSLPPEVQYACQYWAYHLKQGRCMMTNGDEVHQFLETRLLYWLEALGLLGRASESISMIALVNSLDIIDDDPTVRELLYDAKRFILMYSGMIDMAPLQLYSSAIIFAPESSIIRKRFQSCIPKWLGRLPPRQQAWDATLHVFDGHTDLVSSVDFFPNGKQIVSGSHDKTIRIWNVNSGTLDQILEGHWEAVRSVAVSPNGKHLISTSWDRSIRIWDTETGKPIETFGSQGYGTGVFSADNELAAWGLANGDDNRAGRIQVWNFGTRKYSHILGSDDSMVWSLAFAPQEQHLASGHQDGTIKIWDCVLGACLRMLTNGEGSVDSLAYSPNGNRLASGTGLADVCLWDPDAGTLLQTLKHDCSVDSIAFSPDGKTLASGSDEILVWDVITGTLLYRLRGHASDVTSLLFSPDGTQIASASVDATIRMWGISSSNEVEMTKVHSVQFSPDGTLLASASASEGTISLWNTTTGLLTAHITGVVVSDIDTFAFSPDGKRLASVSLGESTHDEQHPDCYVQLHEPDSGLQLLVLEGNMLGIRTMAFSSDSEQLAVILEPGEGCWLWKTTSRLRQRSFTHPTSYEFAMTIAFSPDNRKIAVSFHSGQIDIWDIASSSRLCTLGMSTGIFKYVDCITFSPDSMRLLSSSGDELQGALLWDVTTGNLITAIEREVDGALVSSSLAFSASGDYFAINFDDGLTQVWRLTGSSISLQESFYVGSAVGSLSFCDSEPYLESNRGLIKITSEEISRPTHKATTRRNAIFLKGNWITRDGENLLWIPPNYRPRSLSYRNNILAIAHASGLISFFDFCFDD
ncbi:hypothetical protein MMC10_001574 [Thelotrema lepadinum]|nr:hypothetical protein [Thelotrema lepadinum]